MRAALAENSSSMQIANIQEMLRMCFVSVGFFFHRNRMEMWKIKSDWKPLNIIGSMHAHGSVRVRARSVLM